ncbi:MAG: TRAP transporter substrate-binding protein DctP [Rhodospirillaceae bacterium]|jgi:TRAP-type transport system periplasmic protein|nr:TRAP transporter substrate-binding protein DctP [Rhodospirillaceae bacterium]MBT5940860.1 TRAP transporter substrate-binding protein DctP [Rhodospirillaceae bacterium]
MSNIIKSKSYYVALVAICASFGMTIASPSKAETKLLFNQFLPAKHSFVVGIFKPWAKAVAKESKGRVVVKFSETSLGPPPKQWNVVSKGIADVSLLAIAFERNRIHLPQVAELPFTTPNAVKSSLALWRTYNAKFKSVNEFKGVKLLGLWTTGPMSIMHGNKSISAVADFKNQKMWGFPGLGSGILKKFGAVPVVVPAVKTFNVVSKKIVNGLVIANEALLGFKLLPYIKHLTLVPGGVHAVTFSMIMNEKVWGGLSSADKKAVARASGAKIAMGARASDRRSAGAIAVAKKKGIQVQTASPAFMAELRKGVSPMMNRWLKKAAAKGVDGKAALAFYRSSLK